MASAAALAPIALPPTLDTSANAAPPTLARTAKSPRCAGRARQRKPGLITLIFTCSGEDVTGFVVSANVRLKNVEDPEEVFGCERRSNRSFECEDIHSGAEERGKATLSFIPSACSTGGGVRLKVTAFLNFERAPQPTFTLAVPCPRLHRTSRSR